MNELNDSHCYLSIFDIVFYLINIDTFLIINCNRIKKKFYRYISDKSKAREDVGPLQKKTGHEG